LHCSEIDLTAAGVPHVFRAGLPADLVEFALSRFGEPARPVLESLQQVKV
jgi:hypothetical protein